MQGRLCKQIVRKVQAMWWFDKIRSRPMGIINWKFVEKESVFQTKRFPSREGGAVCRGNVSTQHTHVYSMYIYIYVYVYTYRYITNSMKYSPSWEANRFSASQEIHHILWNPQVHYRIHKISPLAPTMTNINPVHVPLHFFDIHFNIILPSTPRTTERLIPFRIPHQNPKYMHLSSPPYVQHAPPISFFLIWSPEQNLMRSTHHKAPSCVVSSTPLLRRPSLAPTASSAPCSSTPIAYVPPYMWQHKIHTHMKHQVTTDKKYKIYYHQHNIF
jgi:hypothetical protein